jgi:hypothetical protein
MNFLKIANWLICIKSQRLSRQRPAKKARNWLVGFATTLRVKHFSVFEFILLQAEPTPTQPPLRTPLGGPLKIEID